MQKKSALITGISGQDGSYLTELLLEKGYLVHGLVRRHSDMARKRLDDLFSTPESKLWTGKLQLHYGDLHDSASLFRLLLEIRPDEIYNLGAQSHVKVSFDIPEYTADVTGLGTLRLLEAVRATKIEARIYQAGSSEMFGKVTEIPQKETTPFYPRSPYGCSKVFGHWISVNYRESYNMFISNGILFNHESPRRGENFVTRKITLGAAAIKLGLAQKIGLGNLDAKRDWGFAKDYVEAMWLMLQQPEPDDFVIATGETHSVREFCEETFSSLGMDYRDHIYQDAAYLRPSEVDLLIGDPSKAHQKLNWKAKTSFKDLVRIMVDSDMEYLKRTKKRRYEEKVPISQGQSWT